ncbi:MAG TPA: hypothetical protein VLU23_06875 [Pseudolabrys sp.]|jgi:hypothetical protein|nr:hypothetical protein [Pseudolabrys sp.]
MPRRAIGHGRATFTTARVAGRTAGVRAKLSTATFPGFESAPGIYTRLLVSTIVILREDAR